MLCCRTVMCRTSLGKKAGATQDHSLQPKFLGQADFIVRLVSEVFLGKGKCQFAPSSGNSVSKINTLANAFTFQVFTVCSGLHSILIYFH